MKLRALASIFLRTLRPQRQLKDSFTQHESLQLGLYTPTQEAALILVLYHKVVNRFWYLVRVSRGWSCLRLCYLQMCLVVRHRQDHEGSDGIGMMIRNTSQSWILQVVSMTSRGVQLDFCATGICTFGHSSSY